MNSLQRGEFQQVPRISLQTRPMISWVSSWGSYSQITGNRSVGADRTFREFLDEIIENSGYLSPFGKAYQVSPFVQASVSIPSTSTLIKESTTADYCARNPADGSHAESEPRRFRGNTSDTVAFSLVVPLIRDRARAQAASRANLAKANASLRRHWK